jgi:S-adenosylmethionine-diacylgycerolhomoserine-N-methlytransferase
MPSKTEVSRSVRLARDLATLYHLTLKRMQSTTLQERLNGFYAGQESHYDEFRQRLLFGRTELFSLVPLSPGGIWVDMGGGTGASFESLGSRTALLKRAYVVDLCEPLLSVAQARKARNGWDNMEVVHSDALTFNLPNSEQADVVSFSYSLTMIPEWYAAIDHAVEMLKPGGHLAICDFFVAHPFLIVENQQPHGWRSRIFWRAWFEADGVFPSSDHVPYLTRSLQVRHYSQHRAKLPYLPLARAPYYLLLGRKPDH